jgi:nucleotide-binding universal stress UspA family protein
LKDLLVYVDQTECALVRLRLAADLAHRHSSRLTAIYVKEFSRAQIETQNTAELGLASASQACRLNQSIENSIEETAERLRSALENLGRERGIEIEWRCLEGVASVVVPQHARYAGLCILGQDVPAYVNSAGYSFSEQLLFITGRMVAHLRRHNAKVDSIRLVDVRAGSIADALQAEAHKVGADLIVAGAFGHPKLWEKLLGGVTRDLLASMSLPLLMSH